MERQLGEQLSKYLRLTLLCDGDSEEIKKKASELAEPTKTPMAAALKILYFVRDEILFSLDFTYVKASQTLRTRSGLSFQKTNLQVALLRACPQGTTGLAVKSRCFGVSSQVFCTWFFRR